MPKGMAPSREEVGRLAFRITWSNTKHDYNDDLLISAHAGVYVAYTAKVRSSHDTIRLQLQNKIRLLSSYVQDT